jgi:DNA-binding NarL/FixJ family response regulator
MILLPATPTASETTTVPLTRILLVDDHPFIRRVVRETLEDEPGFAVCAEAADGAAARELVASTQPHLALVDLSLGDAGGIDLIKWLAAAYPAVRIIVLSMHDESLYGHAAFHAGAHGYVNKREASSTMIATIRNVMAGKFHCHPHDQEQISPPPPGNPLHPK